MRTGAGGFFQEGKREKGLLSIAPTHLAGWFERGAEGRPLWFAIQSASEVFIQVDTGDIGGLSPGHARNG